MFILFVMFFLAILIGFIFRKSKIATAYILFVDWILAAYKFNAADMQGYIRQYGYITRGIVDAEDFKYPGYYFIQLFSVKLGLSQQAFFNLYYFLCFLLLFIALKRLTPNVNMALSIFTIYPFSIEAIQMKQFGADVLAFLGLTFLITYVTEMQNPVRRIFRPKISPMWLILCVAFIMLGVSVQFSVVFFLILAGYYFLMTIMNRNSSGLRLLFQSLDRLWIKTTRVNLVVTTVGFLAAQTSILFLCVMLVNRFVRIVKTEYISAFMSPKVGLGIIGPIIIILLFCITVYFSVCELKNSVIMNTRQEYVVMQFMGTIILTFIVLSYGYMYLRLFRVYFYILTALVTNKQKNSNHTCYMWGAFFMLIIILSYLDSYQYADTTIIPMLKYNSLFD